MRVSAEACAPELIEESAGEELRALDTPLCPGVDPSIHRHSGIWGAAVEAVLNNVLVHKKKTFKKSPLIPLCFKDIAET
jgi:hypothetical protein